uniref:NADH-ubiquinone oxidoreductase chain 6 n=1 Tax=Eleusine indica TaxID=29674 RepID=A0A3S7EA03_ELEIN|nr:NADH dehydrogenase subunit 6 [Eleusine indica]AVA08892.1 NADH dehydrogenase subunit 6 [Eleusine indica]
MILSVLSSPALVSGLMVVRAKNPVHSVLFPILVFCDTSGLLILLGLDFSAMIFPVVHIGAIAVSFLFVVMMFNIQIAEIHEEVLRYLPVSGIIGLIFWWEMFFILDNETIPLLPTHRNTTSLGYMVYAGKVRSWTNLETLGNLLYTYYSVWFLVSSLILLVAMIGAIVLTMHRTTKVKRQDVFRRNALDSRRTIMRGRGTILNRRCFSSEAGGSSPDSYDPKGQKGSFLYRILIRYYNSIYFYFYLPRLISGILLGLFLYYNCNRLFLLLFPFPLFVGPETLVLASSYNGADDAATSSGSPMAMDDLSQAVAPFLPRGGGAPVTLPEERPLTTEENGRLALVLQYQNCNQGYLAKKKHEGRPQSDKQKEDGHAQRISIRREGGPPLPPKTTSDK